MQRHQTVESGFIHTPPANFRHRLVVDIFEQQVFHQRRRRGEGPGIAEDGPCGRMHWIRREDMRQFFEFWICGNRKEGYRVVAQGALPVSRDRFRGGRWKGAGNWREERILDAPALHDRVHGQRIATWFQPGEGLARAHDIALVRIGVEIDFAAAGAAGSG